jgi:hypothetical protein
LRKVGQENELEQWEFPRWGNLKCTALLLRLMKVCKSDMKCQTLGVRGQHSPIRSCEVLVHFSLKSGCPDNYCCDIPQLLQTMA